MSESAPATPQTPQSEKKTSRGAIAALVLGILSLCCLPFFGIPAIIFGAVSLSAIGNANGRLEGRGLAISGIVMGSISFLMAFVIGIVAAIALPGMARARESARRASCQNNLKQVGLVCKMFANEAENGLWPPLSPVSGHLMFDAQTVFPTYLMDPMVLQCPSDPNVPQATDPAALIDDHSYFYFGYVIENEAQLQLLAEAYASPDFDPSQDIKVAPGQGNGGSDTIYRLREGVERFLVTDVSDPAASAMAASLIPVMMDRGQMGGNSSWFNHIPGGSNVLFMDGHVEFVRYPTRFPMSAEALGILYSMDASGAQVNPPLERGPS